MRSPFLSGQSWASLVGICLGTVRKKPRDPLRCIATEGRDHMGGVEVSRDGHGPVAQALGYHFDAGSQRQARVGMPQIVKADGR
jgi:hypothetical protein